MSGAGQPRAEPRGARIGCADPAAIGIQEGERDSPAPAPDDPP